MQNYNIVIKDIVIMAIKRKSNKNYSKRKAGI